MSLFQTSVLKQHLSLQDQDVVAKAYKKYTKYFLNPTIQENIRGSKEEEYQGIFLTELFVNILGYTLKPNADFNLVAEYKNQNNARKADGAILNNDVAIGVIELKGTNTKDLESIRKQAFDYKANQKGCVYVITSNFEKLRFYINDATEFEEFNLFELSPERFALFYLCLQKDNVLNNNPLKIKEASVVVEEQITKQFYKDYSLFKRELFRDLVKRNVKRIKTEAFSRANQSQLTENEYEKAEQLKLEKNVKLTLFKKSQKLIDRYLFIFFAEDRGLLPPNSTQQILDKWKGDVDFGDERPLYDLFKQYFNFLDQGRKGTTSRAEIYAYNGGLFKEDKVLDSLEIDSALLYKHTSKLAAYDFESQVDVNILGHIFENSLNEIESVNAEIEGGDFDKQKSKRKKDGVFYTPKYITKYIVENTIGKLCDEKKTQLGFKEEEYFKGRKNRNKTTITKLVTILDDYRDWLLQLTICDPACGSGAFLNQALDFLIKEHTYIDELKTKVLGGGLQFPDIENTILENNIYGVDLNEESVEIAKLSLWLRTAQPRRKLNDLSSNIKCGNSLIDSKAVAGDKAFNWKEQFPKVFEKGGFDVVIGNPPYFNIQTMGYQSKDAKFIQENYSEIWQDKSDILFYFFYKAMEITKGEIGFIISNAFLFSDKAKKLRNYMLKDNRISKIINFDRFMIFKDASITSCITFFSQNKTNTKAIVLKDKNYSISEITEILNNKDFEHEVNLESNKVFALVDKKVAQVNEKIDSDHKQLKDVFHLGKGMETAANSVFSFDYYPSQFPDEYIKKRMVGENIDRYFFGSSDSYIIYFEDVDNFEELPNSIQNHLLVNKEILEKRATVKNEGRAWWRYSRPMHKEFYHLNKIWCSYRGLNNKFMLDETDNYIGLTNTTVIFNTNSDYSMKFILSLLNSRLLNFRYKSIGKQTGGGVFEYFANGVGKFPIPKISLINQKPFIEIINKIILEKEVLNDIIEKLKKYLIQTFKLEQLSNKLHNWHELEFGDFIKELNKTIKANNKQRVKEGLEEVPTLTKKDEFEWLDLFEDNKQKEQALQTQINQTDKEIDAMVYELYGLTEDEIVIVENS